MLRDQDQREPAADPGGPVAGRWAGGRPGGHRSRGRRRTAGLRGARRHRPLGRPRSSVGHQHLQPRDGRPRGLARNDLARPRIRDPRAAGRAAAHLAHRPARGRRLAGSGTTRPSWARPSWRSPGSWPTPLVSASSTAAAGRPPGRMSPTSSTPPSSAPPWREVEVELTAEASHASPYAAVEVWADFACGAEVLRRPAFWDGGDRWRLRFAAPHAGEWQLGVGGERRRPRAAPAARARSSASTDCRRRPGARVRARLLADVARRVAAWCTPTAPPR